MEIPGKLAGNFPIFAGNQTNFPEMLKTLEKIFDWQINSSTQNNLYFAQKTV